MNKVRVRYAPSPTGHLHIGGARTALFNYLFAKNNDGDFIVRIEDTDIARNIDGGEASQLENLRWLGIIPDETTDIPGEFGPYRQTERLDIYKQHALELVERGLAYKCYCTPEELSADRERQIEDGHVSPRYSETCKNSDYAEKCDTESKQFSIRLNVPKNKEYKFTDLVRGEVVFNSKDVGDWVIVKQNGIPTYNFAVAIDDHLMEISHVFRGEEHISNTPKQMMIYDMFGWEVPEFGHMTLIVNEQRKKLSKRDETVMQFISQYRGEGYLPEAMFNFFALLGWAPENEEEIFNAEELIKQFSTTRLSKSPSMFDRDKLAWVSNRYFKELTKEQIVGITLPFLEAEYNLSGKNQDWIEEVVMLHANQLSYAKEIVELTKLFFKDEITISKDGADFLAEDSIRTDVANMFSSKLDEMEEPSIEKVKVLIKEVGKELGAKGKNLFMPIRIQITGQMHGPELADTIVLLKRNEK